jgi:hypothetical protein
MGGSCSNRTSVGVDGVKRVCDGLRAAAFVELRTDAQLVALIRAIRNKGVFRAEVFARLCREPGCFRLVKLMAAALGTTADDARALGNKAFRSACFGAMVPQKGVARDDMRTVVWLIDTYSLTSADACDVVAHDGAGLERVAAWLAGEFGLVAHDIGDRFPKKTAHRPVSFTMYRPPAVELPRSWPVSGRRLANAVTPDTPEADDSPSAPLVGAAGANAF